MARLPRLFAAGQPQHVIQRGLQGQAIFTDDADYQFFTGLLRDAVREQEFALHAYVLMPNHLHLLGTPADASSIGRTLQAVGRRYVLYFNRKSHRSGPLWDGRYRATLVEPDELFFCSQYIELNPARAGLADEPKDYRWSSYAHHIGLGANPLLTDHAHYWALGNTPFERQARYRALFEHGLDEKKLQTLRDATNKAWAFGSPAFLEQITTLSNRRLSPLAKGRPMDRSQSTSPRTNSLGLQTD